MAGQGNGYSVLIVDDDEGIRKLIHDALTIVLRIGIVSAENGAEAVRIASLEPPSLILLDMEMPVMAGVEALRRLRADPRTRAVPVICMSGGVPAQVAVEAGCDDFIQKPLSIRDLVDRVRSRLPAS